MHRNTSHVFGIDASLTNTAIVAVSLPDFRQKSLDRSIRTCKIETSPRADLSDRLRQIMTQARAFALSVRQDPAFTAATVAIEGFSFADRFRQYDLGAVQGVLRVVFRESLGEVLHSVTPGNAKAFILPQWEGFSKANWIAAGRTGPWKRSMPGKPEVAQALYARHDFDPHDEHVVDATLVALAHASKQGILPHDPTPRTPSNRLQAPQTPQARQRRQARQAKG